MGGNTDKKFIDNIIGTVNITDNTAAIMPGDSVTFVSIGTASPEWLYENTIYDGDNLYFAHMNTGFNLYKKADLSKDIKAQSGRDAFPQFDWYRQYRRLNQNVNIINGGDPPFFSFLNYTAIKKLSK